MCIHLCTVHPPVGFANPACWVWGVFNDLVHLPPLLFFLPILNLDDPYSFSHTLDMGDYDVRSAASILATVKEQEARFEQLTRALEEERRNVTLQLERSNLPPNPPTCQPLAWQQVVMQVIDASMLANSHPVQPRLFVPVYLSVLLLKVIAPHHYWDC